MGNRTFHILVFALWLLAMGWLVVEKVLPPLRVGEPPAPRSRDQVPAVEKVGWHLRLGDVDLGWAVTQTVRKPSGVTEVDSHVVISHLPLDELTPAWLGAFVRRQIGEISLDAKTHLEVDGLGEISFFRSKIGMPDASDLIRMEGRVEDSTLLLQIRSGEMRYDVQKALPAGALIAGELSPQSAFSRLELGQSWTVPVFSPLQSPSNPLEILLAQVEDEVDLLWDGQRCSTLLVVYRSDPGAGLAAVRRARGRMWVDREGRVLQQEASLLRSQLRFVRMTDQQLEAHLAEEQLGQEEHPAQEETAAPGQPGVQTQLNADVSNTPPIDLP